MPTRFMPLSFFLFLEQLAFARNVSAVAFSDHIFAHGGYRFARNHATADGGLNRHLEHLPRDEFSEARYKIAAAFVGEFAMAHQHQSIHRLAGNQHVQLHQVAFLVSRKVVVERRVAARRAFQAIIEIEHDFV